MKPHSKGQFMHVCNTMLYKTLIDLLSGSHKFVSLLFDELIPTGRIDVKYVFLS